MALDGRSVTVCHKSALSPVYEPVITDSNWNDGHFTHFHFIYCSKFGKFTDDGVTLVPKCGKAVMLLSTQHRTSTVTSVDEEAGDYYVYTSTKQRAVLTFWTNWCERQLQARVICMDCGVFLNMINWSTHHQCGWHVIITKHHEILRRRYCDIVKRRWNCLVCPRKKERKTMRECDTCGTPLCNEYVHLCSDSVSDVRRGRQLTLILSATAGGVTGLITLPCGSMDCLQWLFGV